MKMHTTNHIDVKHTNHYFLMFIIMIISGLLSTMNVWVADVSDIRLSLNDLYMILLMTGWMFALMGIFDRNLTIFGFGAILVVVNIWCIRTQFLITEGQFKMGMIPHHSMAVHMSKKLLEKGIKDKPFQDFVENIANTQRQEINYMKSF